MSKCRQLVSNAVYLPPQLTFNCTRVLSSKSMIYYSVQSWIPSIPTRIKSTIQSSRKTENTWWWKCIISVAIAIISWRMVYTRSLFTTSTRLLALCLIISSCREGNSIVWSWFLGDTRLVSMRYSCIENRPIVITGITQRFLPSGRGLSIITDSSATHAFIIEISV